VSAAAAAADQNGNDKSTGNRRKTSTSRFRLNYRAARPDKEINKRLSRANAGYAVTKLLLSSRCKCSWEISPLIILFQLYRGKISCALLSEENTNEGTFVSFRLAALAQITCRASIVFRALAERWIDHGTKGERMRERERSPLRADSVHYLVFKRARRTTARCRLIR